MSIVDVIQLTKMDYLEKRVTFLENKSRAQDQKIGNLMTELENVKIKMDINYPTKENNQAEESVNIFYPDVNLCEVEVSNCTKNQDPAGAGTHNDNDKIIEVNLKDILSRNLPVKMGESSDKIPSSSPAINVNTESDDQMPNEYNFVNVGEIEGISIKAEPVDSKHYEMDFGFSGSEPEENEVSNKNEQIKSHICSFCKKSFLSNSHLERHIRSHTGEKPFQCDICPKSFSHKHNLKTHLEVHAGVKPFSCPICSRSFSFNAHLKDHFIKLHSGQTYSCSVCSKNFTSEKNKKIHELTHTENSFECTICNKQFTLQHFLNGHMKREHFIKEEINYDPLDQSQDVDQIEEPPEFIYSEDFVNPEENENEAAINQTPVCSKSFTRSQPMSPQSPEEKEKAFLCEICSKTFNLIGKLKNHIKHVHMNERPHACTICPKTFTYSSHLNEHIQSVHSDEKLFSCPVCFKKISRKRDLKRHLKTHSTSRPFECEICKKNFALEATLTGHMKRVHSISFK